MSDTLTELFAAKQRRAAPDAVNWGRRRQEYVDALDALYVDIADWLREPIGQQMVELCQNWHKLDERYLGVYQAPELTIRTFGEEVNFIPRGCNIVGAAGRLDVQGDAGRQTLLLEPGRGWSLLEARELTAGLVSLDEKRFAALLREVMRP